MQESLLMAKWSRPSSSLVATFESLISQLAGAELRKMFGCPCAFTRSTRQLFTGIHQEDWLVRLPESGREELTAMGAQAFSPMGRAMTEYVLLPDLIREDPTERLYWVRRALVYAESLPIKESKPAKKRKK